MDLYSIVLFVHIAFAIVWLGGGVAIQLFAAIHDRASDAVGLEKTLTGASQLGPKLFTPAGLIVLAAGIFMTIDGPWSFGSLWIILALIGFVASFGIGILWLGPQAERINEIAESEGRMTPEAHAMTMRALVVARVDTVILFLIVFNMVIKPAGSDIGTLIFMAAALALGSAFFIWRGRSIEIEGGAGAETEPAVPA